MLYKAKEVEGYRLEGYEHNLNHYYHRQWYWAD
jgi:hypothetical protein